jgi:hypothetical protein
MWEFLLKYISGWHMYVNGIVPPAVTDPLKPTLVTAIFPSSTHSNTPHTYPHFKYRFGAQDE